MDDSPTSAVSRAEVALWCMIFVDIRKRKFLEVEFLIKLRPETLVSIQRRKRHLHHHWVVDSITHLNSMTCLLTWIRPKPPETTQSWPVDPTRGQTKKFPKFCPCFLSQKFDQKSFEECAAKNPKFFGDKIFVFSFFRFFVFSFFRFFVFSFFRFFVFSFFLFSEPEPPAPGGTRFRF